jgi:hypothetical protein
LPGLSYLTCGINDLGGEFLSLKLDNLAECVLNGGVVALNEMAIDKLNGEGRFACMMGQRVVACAIE